MENLLININRLVIIKKLLDIPNPKLFDNKRYQLGKKIGSGGHGNVFIVKDLNIGKHICAKIIPKQIETEIIFSMGEFEKKIESTKDAVLHEVKILMKLLPTCNPYILCLIDFYEDDKNYYVMLEYLKDYQNLTSFNVTHMHNKNSIVGLIINNLAKGLMKMHELHIIHRDIKPANIMYSNNGDIKYIDFGSACFSNECTTKTTDSIRYRAPENWVPAMYDKKETHKHLISHDFISWKQADLWAFGCVLFNVLVDDPNIDIYTILNETVGIRQAMLYVIDGNGMVEIIDTINQYMPSFKPYITLLQSLEWLLTKPNDRILDQPHIDKFLKDMNIII